jgi:hypothetical protein
MLVKIESMAESAANSLQNSVRLRDDFWSNTITRQKNKVSVQGEYDSPSVG